MIRFLGLLALVLLAALGVASAQTVGNGGPPVPCPTAGANVTIAGTTMPNCSIAASSGGSTWPFAIVQAAVCSGGVTSLACAFQQAATANDTLLVFCFGDSRDTDTTPSGYTDIASQASSSFSQINVYRKTAAGGETTVTLAQSGTQTTLVGYLIEVAGNHALDQVATANAGVSGNANLFWSYPGLTPSVGAMTFVTMSTVNSSATPPQLVGANWTPYFEGASATYRSAQIGILAGPGAGTAITPPQGYGASATQGGDTIATAAFSIL